MSSKIIDAKGKVYKENALKILSVQKQGTSFNEEQGDIKKEVNSVRPGKTVLNMS